MKVKRIITASYITAVACVSLHLAAETLPPLPKGAFTYAVIPDTQSYDGEGRNTKRGRKAGLGPTRNKKFDAIIDWLLDNAKRENIVFVTHTGDITDMNNDFQWTFASNAMSRLDGKLPYSVVPGNHDMKSSGDTSLFQRYFPASRYIGNDWYASTFAGFTNSASIFVSGNNANSICLFGEGKERFVLVNLECNAPDPVLRWAAKELEQFADRHIIVATHQDLGAIESKNARRILRDTKGMSKEERNEKLTQDVETALRDAGVAVADTQRDVISSYVDEMAAELIDNSDKDTITEEDIKLFMATHVPQTNVPQIPAN
jgi:3',5'-cyclic AMP phosphodiesterase CpdA